MRIPGAARDTTLHLAQRPSRDPGRPSIGTSTSRSICAGSVRSSRGSARSRSESLAAFDRGGDDLAAQRHADDVLQSPTVSRSGKATIAVGLDVEVLAAGHRAPQGREVVPGTP